jgi:hypothetical protein
MTEPSSHQRRRGVLGVSPWRCAGGVSRLVDRAAARLGDRPRSDGSYDAGQSRCRPGSRPRSPITITRQRLPPGGSRHSRQLPTRTCRRRHTRTPPRRRPASGAGSAGMAGADGEPRGPSGVPARQADEALPLEYHPARCSRGR